MCFRFFLALLLCVSGLSAQEENSVRTELGLQLQQYPTGTIPGMSVTIPLRQPRQRLQLRLGYNIVYHGDAGVRENEEGGGFGFSPAFLFALSDANKGIYLGGRLDFWFNRMDWMDNIGQVNEIRGETSIVVVQPTVLIGFRLPLGENYLLTPELALGAEINTLQDGEDVGQGAILLAGITFARRL